MLVWGEYRDETLFWLEVGDEHKSIEQIEEVTFKRLDQARRVCKQTGARLVYAQLSANWVYEAARWACVDLPKDVAMAMGKGSFGNCQSWNGELQKQHALNSALIFFIEQ